jgi:FAD/FMN-containing dehydrogenase
VGMILPGLQSPDHSTQEDERVEKRAAAIASAPAILSSTTLRHDASGVSLKSPGGVAPPVRAPHERAHSLAQIVGSANVWPSPRFNSAPQPCLEAAPASAEEAIEVLRLAAREGWAVVPAGAGTWLDSGNSLRRAEVIINTRRMQRMIEHEPADLVASAEAGLPLAALNQELARSGQWLPLDPPDDGRATIGGVVATGLGGAQSFGHGMPRNYVIGMRVALADGTVIKAGGRVVKNVAGYDLCKLFTGSYGTLGLILELTFKLRPEPTRTATLLLTAPLGELLLAARAALDAHLLPVAIEVVSPEVAARLRITEEGSRPSLLIRFAGSPEAVSDQIERAINLPAIGQAGGRNIEVDEDDAYWRALAALPLEESHQLIWRAGLRPTALATLLDGVSQKSSAVFPTSALWHAGLGDGKLRVMIPRPGGASSCVAALGELRARLAAEGGSLVIETAPQQIKGVLDAWGDAGTTASLNRRVKQELDPQGLLSPGRFVAGI